MVVVKVEERAHSEEAITFVLKLVCTTTIKPNKAATTSHQPATSHC